jgi:diacylglycerol diphosphate phosphatase/phosphatidate phosphatase
MFLSLWIAGKTAAWCFHSPSSTAAYHSRLGAFFLTLLPLFWATFVAVSRIEDYVSFPPLDVYSKLNLYQRHHKEDVIAGSLIGIFSALICYHIFWPSPFFIENFTPEQAGRPRALYSDRLEWRSRNADFELTRLEEEIENV